MRLSPLKHLLPLRPTTPVEKEDTVEITVKLAEKERIITKDPSTLRTVLSQRVSLLNLIPRIDIQALDTPVLTRDISERTVLARETTELSRTKLRL